MGWPKSIAIVAGALLLLAAVGGLGCGGGDEGAQVDLSDLEAVLTGHLEALSEAGKVFHGKAVWQQPEGEGRIEILEGWVDVENGRFRQERRIERAGEETTDFWVTVGTDWTMTSYSSSSNSVNTYTVTTEERAEAAKLGMDSFGYFGLEYLPVLIGCTDKRLVGESTVEGRPVVLVEGRWSTEPDGGDWPEGATHVITVALDRESLLPAQVQSETTCPDCEDQLYGSHTFEVTEYLSPDDLPADFFSPQSVEELVTPKAAE
ncbi:MAG: hypothetical protein ACUVV3_08060 [Dehalococcoidia bacterium]